MGRDGGARERAAIVGKRMEKKGSHSLIYSFWLNHASCQNAKGWCSYFGDECGNGEMMKLSFLINPPDSLFKFKSSPEMQG